MNKRLVHAVSYSAKENNSPRSPKKNYRLFTELLQQSTVSREVKTVAGP
jgi:hypothetical protein